MLHLATLFCLIHCSGCIVPKLGWNKMSRTNLILQGYGLLAVYWTVVPGCFALPGDVHCVLGLLPVQRVLSSCWLLRDFPSCGQTQLHQVPLQKKRSILSSLQSKIQPFMVHLQIIVSSCCSCFPLWVSSSYSCAFFLPCTHWHLQMRWLQVWCLGEGETVQRATVVITKVSSGKDLD